MREARRQRDEDRERIKQAQGHSLLFKMVRIYSNFHGMHRHIEEGFEEATKKGLGGEPWQFVLPLANPPDYVQFSSEEMGMLLTLKQDDVFNSVAEMDIIHNSLSDAVKLLNNERRSLTERLTHEEAKGAVLSGTLSKDQMLSLRPRMIEVNGLIESIRSQAERDFNDSRAALDSLHTLLKEKLGLAYKLEHKVPPGPPSLEEFLRRSQRG